jgi:ketosteroid isomerase-like protein
VTNPLETLLEAFARGALDEAVACFAVDAVYREPRKPALHGRDAIAAHFAVQSARARAWRFLLEETFTSGAHACVTYRYATREGTGEAWSERAGCAVVRVDERGEIALWREYEG